MFDYAYLPLNPLYFSSILHENTRFINLSPYLLNLSYSQALKPEHESRPYCLEFRWSCSKACIARGKCRYNSFM